MRRLAQVLLVLLLVAVAFVTLWPSPVDEPGRSGLLAGLERLHAAGVPGWVDYSFVERAANVVMFVPYGALLAVLLPVRRWWWAVLVPAGTSVLIEVAQHLFLPRRTASVWDVAANTAGAVVGVAFVAVVVVLHRRRDRRAPAAGPALTSAARPSSAPPWS